MVKSTKTICLPVKKKLVFWNIAVLKGFYVKINWTHKVQVLDQIPIFSTLSIFFI